MNFFKGYLSQLSNVNFNKNIGLQSIEYFNKAINELNMKDISISVKNTQNADSIRNADTVIKNLKEELIKLDDLRPKNCNCDCVWEEGSSWSDYIELNK